MRKKDMPLIIISVFVSAILSLILSNLIFGNTKNYQESVEVVDSITPEFNVPKKDDIYFNSKSINPTQLIRIGGSNNEQPFRNE